MSLDIRTFDPEADIEGLKRCFVDLQNHEHDFAPEAPTGAELVDDYLPFMVDRVRESGGEIFVADLDDQLIGFATAIVIARSEPDDIDPFHVELAELSVIAGGRGHGVGALLISAVEAFARERCAPSLRIRVDARNSGARRLYDRLGFSELRIKVEKRL